MDKQQARPATQWIRVVSKAEAWPEEGALALGIAVVESLLPAAGVGNVEGGKEGGAGSCVTLMSTFWPPSQ